MFQIKTMNKISPFGLERLPADAYAVSDDCAAPDGVHLSAGNGYGAWVNYLRSHTLYAAGSPWTAGSAFAQ